MQVGRGKPSQNVITYKNKNVKNANKYYVKIYIVLLIYLIIFKLFFIEVFYDLAFKWKYG